MPDMNYIGHFILGLFIAASAVLIQVFLRRGIESPEELEEIGVTVYASIPVSQWLMKKTNKKNLCEKTNWA